MDFFFLRIALIAFPQQDGRPSLQGKMLRGGEITGNKRVVYRQEPGRCCLWRSSCTGELFSKIEKSRVAVIPQVRLNDCGSTKGTIPHVGRLTEKVELNRKSQTEEGGSLMLKNRLLTWLLVLLLITGLSLPLIVGCAPSKAPEAEGPIRVVDDTGREIILEKAAERIVSAAPNNTEILFALGLGQKVVGVGDSDDYPEEVKEKEKVGGLYDLSVEKIISLQPDLVLVISGAEEAVARLEDKGLVIYTAEPKTLDQTLENIRKIGQLTGAHAQAQELISQMQEDIEAVKSRVADIAEEKRPKVFWVVWNDPLMSAGQDTFISDLIVTAGGVNILALDGLTGWPEYSVEKLIEHNPDVIIAPESLAPTPDVILQDARLSSVKAVQGKRVYVVPDNLVVRPGPRVTQGLLLVAKAIHPELFQ
ncbi:MAG: Vitamin B12-binding protein [Actinobacteria bacterium]|nr:Vitamin B12-binding protein [Actinomycetota bacterium]